MSGSKPRLMDGDGCERGTRVSPQSQMCATRLRCSHTAHQRRARNERNRQGEAPQQRTVHLSRLSLSRLSTSLALCRALSTLLLSSSSPHASVRPSPASSARPGFVRPRSVRAAGERPSARGRGVLPPGVRPAGDPPPPPPPRRDASTAERRSPPPPPPRPGAAAPLPSASPARGLAAPSAKLRLAFLAIRCASSSLLSVSLTLNGPTAPAPAAEASASRSVTGVASIVPHVMSSWRACGGRDAEGRVGRASTKEKPPTRGVAGWAAAGSVRAERTSVSARLSK